MRWCFFLFSLYFAFQSSTVKAADECLLAQKLEEVFSARDYQLGYANMKLSFPASYIVDSSHLLSDLLSLGLIHEKFDPVEYTKKLEEFIRAMDMAPISMDRYRGAFFSLDLAKNRDFKVFEKIKKARDKVHEPLKKIHQNFIAKLHARDPQLLGYLSDLEKNSKGLVPNELAKVLEVPLTTSEHHDFADLVEKVQKYVVNSTLPEPDLDGTRKKIGALTITLGSLVVLFNAPKIINIAEFSKNMAESEKPFRPASQEADVWPKWSSSREKIDKYVPSLGKKIDLKEFELQCQYANGKYRVSPGKPPSCYCSDIGADIDPTRINCTMRAECRTLGGNWEIGKLKQWGCYCNYDIQKISLYFEKFPSKAKGPPCDTARMCSLAGGISIENDDSSCKCPDGKVIKPGLYDTCDDLKTWCKKIRGKMKQIDYSTVPPSFKNTCYCPKFPGETHRSRDIESLLRRVPGADCRDASTKKDKTLPLPPDTSTQ